MLIEAFAPSDNDGKFEKTRDFSSSIVFVIVKLVFARLREFASASVRTCSRLIVWQNKPVQLIINVLKKINFFTLYHLYM